MFRSIKFRARIIDKDRGLTIPQVCEFNPNKKNVEKVDIECADGAEIVITVHLTARHIAIENGHAETALSPINAEEGLITPRAGDLTIVSEHAKVSLSLSCADLKPILDETAPTGERYFGLFRSALDGIRALAGDLRHKPELSSEDTKGLDKLEEALKVSLKKDVGD